MKSSSIAQLLGGALVSTLLLTSLPATAQTFFGSGATINNATDVATANVGLGHKSLFSNTIGSSNTAIGYYSLFSNTGGSYNTATGAYALYNTLAGSYNTANGYTALYNNTTGAYNVGNGFRALYFNTTGNSNTANGTNALYSNTAGNSNTANGVNALYFNSTGDNNTATGYASLYRNTAGYNNTANGYNALLSNTTGYNNVANGTFALYKNTTGNQNTANGYQSLFNSTGPNNIGIGYRGGFNLTTGNYNIAIGNQGVAAENGAIRIGTSGLQKTAYIAGINGVTSSAGVAVYINASGKLGTVTSSRRFKNEIKTMGNVSDKLLQLRPVTFRYKQSDEKGGHPLQYGLIAEEVAKVFPDLVQYDKQGKPFTIYYHLLTPMILNELQKERATRKTEISALKASYIAKIDSLEAKLASMAQTQAEQQKLLVKLAAYVQNGKNNVPVQKVNVVQH